MSPAVLFITGVEGIEPSSGVLETLILPMNYTPIGIGFTLKPTLYLYHRTSVLSTVFSLLYYCLPSNVLFLIAI